MPTNTETLNDILNTWAANAIQESIAKRTNQVTVFKILPSQDDKYVYPLAEFVGLCTSTSFIDSDGFGRFAMQTMQGVYVESDIRIYPLGLLSMLVKDLPAWATHVVWYNK